MFGCSLDILVKSQGCPNNRTLKLQTVGCQQYRPCASLQVVKCGYDLVLFAEEHEQKS